MCSGSWRKAPTTQRSPGSSTSERRRYKLYVSRLYRKLDLNNRAQLATYLAHTDIGGQSQPECVERDSRARPNDPTPIQAAADRR